MLEVGLRVIRGQDWKWDDQDGGEGHTGTVVEIGKPPSFGNSASSPNPSDRTPDKTVIVQWDHGSRSNYRIGYQGAYDLLVFDNAATGVKHANIICDGCKRHGIIGIRWKCIQCCDYDLCTQCYMADVHNLSHCFERFQTANSVGVQLTPRENCTKIPLKGIFIGAKVVRGPDWEWGNQDGGRGKTGRVMDIRGWDNESSRSVATVTWSKGSTNVYRLGYKGCVDLCYVEEATAGTYYKEHLPLLGQPVMTVSDNLTNVTPTRIGVPSSVSSPRHLTFNVGDKIKVLVDVETLKEMQEGHGGWNPRMAEYIGKVGRVHRITDKRDVRVQFEGCNNRWTFHPGALTKVTSKDTFSLGDIVRVKTDLSAVKLYQRGHGEWIDVMKNALGKTGKVIKIYSDGDLRVALDGHTWTFNPLSVTLVPPGTETVSLQDEANRSRDWTADGVDTEVEKLLRDAARGEAGVSAVQEFLKKYPGRVDARAGGPGGGKKTCLQVAAHQGQRDLCTLLLDAGASLRAVDEDGDTPLHYAAFGATEKLVARARHLVDVKKEDGFAALHLAALNGHKDVAAILLSPNGGNAKVDLRNNRRQTPLHLATSQGHWALVELLVHHNADIASNDADGDTVLHIAIVKSPNQTNVVPTSESCRDSPLIYAIWQNLARQNAKTELALACFLVSVDRSCTLLEHMKNSKNKTPLDLLEADPQIAAYTDLVRCYQYQSHSTELEIENAPASQPSIYQIDTTLQSEMVRGNRKGIPGSGDATECHSCLGIVTNATKDGSTFNAGSSVTIINCAHCGHGIAKTEAILDGQLATGEIPLTNQEEKIKDSALEEQKKEENEDKEREKDKDLERLRYLETRVADLEEANMCSICMERRRNVAFLCGHGACEHCAAPLKTCHMCRKVITKKINLY
ncbi:E3 ubiquitin-protein ligase MIB2 [Habropoda laboriosa]|uniref:RING-type E3 ubiquitin transferase n=1 Tax=Habropoda laboriosa TaxID=597456 RepID=A0A0L7R0S5_9HYME|nr:E3 ubiquitin-protein ligase MIB2 [Habropoda laboriosa]